MTKEEKRFTAAVAAMQAFLSDLAIIEYDKVANSAVKMADALIDKLMEDENKIPYYLRDGFSWGSPNEPLPLPPYEKDLFANSKNINIIMYNKIRNKK